VGTEQQPGTFAVPETNRPSSCTNAQDRGFGEYSSADDRMHDELGSLVQDPALVETQYLGFSVPSAALLSYNYAWVHPNIGTAGGGAWAWRRINPSQLHSELFDMRDFLPLSAVGDFSSYRLPNGYGVEVIKPLEEIRISYEDPVRNNAFDVTLSAIMPPAMLASGLHFEQAMRTRGIVRLLGEEHAVDGFTIRDRSWGEPRPEHHRQAPPLHWITPVFNEDFAIHACAVEDPSARPLYSGVVDISSEQAAALGRGWVWHNGELTVLASVTLTCEWDCANRYPASYRVEMVDAVGRAWSLTGTLIAASNWHIWSNIFVAVCLFRWECDSQVGFGDAQVAAWTDFVRQRLS
jgi:hypothetical protein